MTQTSSMLKVRARVRVRVKAKTDAASRASLRRRGCSSRFRWGGMRLNNRRTNCSAVSTSVTPRFVWYA